MTSQSSGSALALLILSSPHDGCNDRNPLCFCSSLIGPSLDLASIALTALVYIISKLILKSAG